MDGEFCWLDEDALLSLRVAALRANLSRGALLGGLSPAVRAGISVRDNPGEQFLEDLRWLNGIEKLKGGDVPLRSWLRTAAHLSALRREAAVFRDALEKMSRKEGGAPSGAGGSAGDGGTRELRGPLWKVGDVAEFWQHPDAATLLRIMKSYGAPRALHDVALQARFDTSRILWTQDLDGAARDLMTAALKSMHIEAILEVMNNDPRIKIHHDALRAMRKRGP